MLRRLGLLSSLLALSGCALPSRSQCLVGPTFKVLIKSNIPSALDGYDYLICPTPDGKSCDRHNRLQTLGPIHISVSIIDNDILVSQVGGSIGSYQSDPGGMSDPNYKQSHPIYLSFFKAMPDPVGTDIKGFIGDRRVALRDCSVS